MGKVEFECNFGKEYYEEMESTDLPIAACLWLENGTHAVEYNLCYDKQARTNSSAIYKMNADTQDTFHLIYEHYEVDFSDGQWEKKLRYAMEDAARRFWEDGVVREMPIELRLGITEEVIDDIMVSALEGGITYWCDIAKVPEDKRVAKWGHEQIARGGELRIHVIEPFDDEETEWYTLDMEKFMKGLKKYVQDPLYDCLIVDRKKLIIDTTNIDGACADTIIQYALFGEEVFG